MGVNDNKPPSRAVALQYDEVDAPRVTASGRGAIADRIIEVGNAHNVPLHENDELAVALAQIPLGEEIPEALYVAVAEILAFVYYLNGKEPPRR